MAKMTHDVPDTIVHTGESLLAVVERVWLDEARAGFCLSARDIQLARGWQAARIPPEVLERALRLAFERWRQAQPHDGRSTGPRGLRFAVRFVDEAIAHHRKTHAGTPATPIVDAAPARVAVGFARLESELVRLGRDVDDDTVRGALRAGYRCLIEQRTQPIHVLWAAVRGVVFDTLEASLRPDVRARLARTLDECDDHRMSESARRAQRIAQREAFFAETFALQSLLHLPNR